MFTLDIKRNITVYSIITIFVLIFSTVYAHYSHEVYSNYMKYAFLIPLIGEVVLFILNKLVKISVVNYYLLNSTVAIFTLDFIVRGIIEIFGTTNELVVVYSYVGFIFLFLFIVSVVLSFIHKIKKVYK